MASIKISSKVEQAEWKALQDLAREPHQSISGLPDSPVQFLSLDDAFADANKRVAFFATDVFLRLNG